MGTTVKDFQSHFGFHGLPLTREVPVDKLFRLPFLTEGVDALVAAVTLRQCTAAIGPAGSGKTSLQRLLRSRLPEVRFRVHYVKVTDLSKRDLCDPPAPAPSAVNDAGYGCLREPEAR